MFFLRYAVVQHSSPSLDLNCVSVPSHAPHDPKYMCSARKCERTKVLNEENEKF